MLGNIVTGCSVLRRPVLRELSDDLGVSITSAGLLITFAQHVVLYVGQAVGSAIGGFLYARGLLHAACYVAAAFVVLALVILTKPNKSDCKSY